MWPPSAAAPCTLQEWQALCEQLLPPPAKEARSGRPELGERAREEVVDGALAVAQVGGGVPVAVVAAVCVWPVSWLRAHASVRPCW